MTTNKYILQALDAYPYNLENAVEALEYALSYNSDDLIALGLMGQLYAEILHDYSTSKNYYERALAVDIYSIKTYYGYIDVLLKNEDYAIADTIIEFALKIKGICKATIYLKKAMLHEYQLQYKMANKAIKNAKLYAFNESMIAEIDKHAERIKQKKLIKNN